MNKHLLLIICLGFILIPTSCSLQQEDEITATPTSSPTTAPTSKPTATALPTRTLTPISTPSFIASGLILLVDLSRDSYHLHSLQDNIITNIKPFIDSNFSFIAWSRSGCK